MHRLSRKLTAWLGIFAIWLTVLGPLVSQVEARASHMEMPVCGADSGAHADHGHPSGKQAGQHAQHGLHLDACGYCSLLAHSPALGTVPPVLQSAQQSPDFVSPVAPAAKRRFTRYTRGYPRAPPIDA
ncbi:DUF2946 domain-containing protein [Trinickia sp. YCB016]